MSSVHGHFEQIFDEASVADILSVMAGIVLVTGPQAAGKTTVSALLARRFERGVHLDGDAFTSKLQPLSPEQLLLLGGPLVGDALGLLVGGEDEQREHRLLAFLEELADGEDLDPRVVTPVDR